MEKIPELTSDEERDIAWTGEEIESVPSWGWMYRFVCFMLRKKKLTYREMFMLLYGINKKSLGEREAKEFATQRIIAIYEYNNNKLPEGIHHERT
jgi:hypothetical protein